MGWAEEMDQHCQTFRDVWSESGLEGIPWFEVDDLQAEFEDVDRRIVRLYQAFAAGDPEQAGRQAAMAKTARMKLTEDMYEDMDSLDMYLRDWDGEAADNFRDYLNRMTDAFVRKEDCIAAAEQCLVAYEDALRAYRHDIEELVSLTHDLLDKLDGAKERAQQGVMLTIVSAVVNAASWLAPGKTGKVAKGPAAAGVTSSLLSGTTGSKNLMMQADSNGKIIRSMVDEGEKILEEVNDAKRRIENAFFAVTEQLTNVSEENLPNVRPERPNIITDKEFDPDRFHHEDQPDGIADQVDNAPAVEEPPPDNDRDIDRSIVDPNQPMELDPRNPFDLWKPPEPVPHDVYPEQ
ncbi:hypothetical protein EV191_12020 [Tamaricihabitans halophyticus]|uniref:Uncharacterized protein n=1 Tax=Tamaricihabitans halophyticus TaxID=1262583 RepID=A0A4V6NR33_9PSEU|nr:hypothetical protein [Tamaricihabitans halophyticus]TCP43866.1 hypothetical protein EV191_12020 [Tamaricihabitans halophyticus]